MYSLKRFVPSTQTDPRPVVAAFDVDGTLTRRDSVGPFLRRVAGRRLGIALARHPRALVGGLLCLDHDVLKALACSSMAGLDEASVGREGAAFAGEIAGRRLRPDTAARLRRHRELGHAVVLVSASLEPYVAPLGKLLGADDVLCTRLEAIDGRLTGRLLGANCRGPEKARRLRAWLDRRQLEAPEIWAYGDSAGDDELLEMADHPVRVGRTTLPADPVA